jgi:hypothetical protein
MVFNLCFLPNENNFPNLPVTRTIMKREMVENIEARTTIVGGSICLRVILNAEATVDQMITARIPNP